MRTRLREYFHQSKHLRDTLSHKHLLTQMSPMLQGEVAWHTNEKWLRRVWFFEGAEHAFVIQVSMHLTPMVFTPGELVPIGYLYIVHRGIALYGGRVLTGGRVWGDDMILALPALQRRWCARAMNYLEVLMLSRDTLITTAGYFPETARRIRRFAVRLALTRYVIAAAREYGASHIGVQSAWKDTLLAASQSDNHTAQACNVSMLLQRRNCCSMASPPVSTVTSITGGKTSTFARSSHSILREKERSVENLMTGQPNHQLEAMGDLGAMTSPPSGVQRDDSKQVNHTTSTEAQTASPPAMSKMQEDISRLRDEMHVIHGKVDTVVSMIGSLTMLTTSIGQQQRV